MASDLVLGSLSDRSQKYKRAKGTKLDNRVLFRPVIIESAAMLDRKQVACLDRVVACWCNGSSNGGARMMITMLIVFTIGGQNFERHEPMPNLATCWERAPERMNALLAAHPEMTKLAVGCVINNGDPI
jgi:hypothetical protein